MAFGDAAATANLRLSHAYMAAVEANPGNHYTAVHGDATAFLLEDRVLSRRIAEGVFGRLRVVTRTARGLRTSPPARVLLQGQHEAASVVYCRACASCDHAPGIVATIQRQFDMHAQALGVARTDLACP